MARGGRDAAQVAGECGCDSCILLTDPGTGAETLYLKYGYKPNEKLVFMINKL